MIFRGKSSRRIFALRIIYPVVKKKREKETRRKEQEGNNKKRLIVCSRISLNYERYGRFFEATDLPYFSPEIDPYRRETRQRSLIFHRGNRFYRGLPRLAQSDSWAQHRNS